MIDKHLIAAAAGYTAFNRHTHADMTPWSELTEDVRRKFAFEVARLRGNRVEFDLLYGGIFAEVAEAVLTELERALERESDKTPWRKLHDDLLARADDSRKRGNTRRGEAAGAYEDAARMVKDAGAFE